MAGRCGRVLGNMPPSEHASGLGAVPVGQRRPCLVLFALARKLGTYILTKTMDRRPEVGLESYDRLFPNQDTLPQGGFGNLIALPLQKRPRESGNSVFLDERFTPYLDQW